MSRCKPHHWATPAVGDTGLRCGACRRHLDFLVLGEKQRADIAASVARRRGEEAAILFRAAMGAAKDADKDRRDARRATPKAVVRASRIIEATSRDPQPTLTKPPRAPRRYRRRRNYRPPKPAPRYPSMSQPRRRVPARKKAVSKTQKVTVPATQKEALREARQEALRKTLTDARRAARQGERPRSHRRGIAKPGKSFTWFPSRRTR